MADTDLVTVISCFVLVVLAAYRTAVMDCYTSRVQHERQQCMCDTDVVHLTSSLIAERPRCRVGQFWPKTWRRYSANIIGMSSTSVT